MVLRSGKKRKPLKTAGRRKKLKPDASSSAPPPPSPPWVELPRDITADILKRVDVADIVETVQNVCTTWRSVCMEPSMFRKIDLCLSTHSPLYYQILWGQAIDRSQGQLQDLTISPNGDSPFLDYVAQRSPELRCLTLSACSVTGEEVVEAVKKFPLLQELSLYHIPVAGELIEQIGRCCPLLRSFTYYKKRPVFLEKACDMEALAIAKTMPGLRHLCLFGNRMSNQALVAILDVCVHLESLDIRLCYNVGLSVDLEKRCCRQIKRLKKSNDFTAVWPDFPGYYYIDEAIYDPYSPDFGIYDTYSPNSGLDNLIYPPAPYWWKLTREEALWTRRACCWP